MKNASFDRREFLKGTGWMLGAALAGCFYDYPLRITFGPHAGGPNFKAP